MSIIQSLREKGAWIMTAVIAFALLVFVVEEGLRNKGGLGGGSNTLGTVNGTKIDAIEFEEKFKRMSDNYAQMGYNMDENTQAQQRNVLWNQLVEDALLEKEYDKLGLDVTDKELGDYLYGDNPPPDFRQRFTDPNTQMFDPNAAFNAMQQIKRNPKSAEYRSIYGEYIPALIRFRKRENFEAMISNSAYVPKWLVEKTSAEESQVASFSYVEAPYMSIPDSSMKVTDAEINEYVAKHKALFKQEKAAGIDYVLFSAAPSKTDSAAIEDQLKSAKAGFAAAQDINQYLQTEQSGIPFYDSYIARKEIKIGAIDSIISQPVGSVYGPYLDGNSYVIARVVGTKAIPERVKVRHILVATQQQDQQTGQLYPVKEETAAKALIDSIANAIRTGSNFDTLCTQFSDDGAQNKAKGGVYDSVVSGQMDAAFNDFIFTNPVGSKGVVKTVWGYHYVEVLAHNGATLTGYKVAYLSRPVLTSDETDNYARGAATLFASESRTKKQFEDNAKKKSLEIFNAAEIKPLDPSIRGVGISGGSARELIRWIFNDAKVGDVAEKFFTLKNANYSVYVVPVVTQLYEEGLMGADRARMNVEYRIRQEKKAKIIRDKIGSANTLDAVSKALNQPIQKADSVFFSRPMIPNVGNEVKVVGAAFNKAYQSAISPAITGETGVFVIKTESVGAVPNALLDIKSQQEQQILTLRSFNQRNLVENLKKAATIKDMRYKFF